MIRELRDLALSVSVLVQNKFDHTQKHPLYIHFTKNILDIFEYLENSY